MGSISGNIEAKCKKCKCRYVWSMSNFPFVDAEIIGTCNDCFDKKDHNCYDEYSTNKAGGFEFQGRKRFRK